MILEISSRRIWNKDRIGDILARSWRAGDHHSQHCPASLNSVPYLLQSIKMINCSQRNRSSPPFYKKCKDFHIFGRGHLEKFKFRRSEVIAFLSFLAFLVAD